MPVRWWSECPRGGDARLPLVVYEDKAGPVTDLSKIEAGRMELDPTVFDLLTAIDHALTFVPRTGRAPVTLRGAASLIEIVATG